MNKSYLNNHPPLRGTGGGLRGTGGGLLLVVFDDDPTGIQTVHGCLLVTDWSEENLKQAFEDEQKFFYVLTNSRALTAAEAEKTLTSAVEAVLKVNEEYGYRLICVSRSDSCLRGHFPLETDVMRRVLEAHNIKVWPRTTFCPAFIESGRVTIDDVHYMKNGEQLIPVSETEFARDNVFGYTHSNLVEYIKEKGGNPDDYDIVNAQSYAELDTYRDRLFEEIKDFDGAVVIRSSSSLPRSMSGISDKPLLSKQDLGIREGGVGLFIVGSHVQKTTRQLNQLLACPGTKGIELPIDRILDDRDALMDETIHEIISLISSPRGGREGATPVVYTSRKEVRIDDPVKRQHLGQTVSNFLVDIVRNVTSKVSSPRGGKEGALSYLVAKGGITSHDILTHGLDVKVGRVMGQAINSVPCLLTNSLPGGDGQTSLPGGDGQTSLPYIIFPGNVGNDDSLKEIYLKFR